MHLGRFHATIYDLASHFKKAKIFDQLELLASLLDQIQSNPSDELIKQYRDNVDNIKKSSNLNDIDLDKPYAQQIIDELQARTLFNPEFSNRLDEISQSNTFSAHATAKKIRDLAKSYKIRTDHIISIDNALGFFDVEFERVYDGECEIGMLLPREIVGETLPDLSKEFSKFGTLFKEVNELTGADDYDPKIRTISSSWWQFFVELQPDQVSAWIDVTKGIVELWVSVLALKKAKQELEQKDVSAVVLDALEKDIQSKVDTGVRRVAEELRAKHGKLENVERANELENGISQGLRHMAKRISEGGQVQIDVSPPKETEEEEKAADVTAAIQAKREQIALMRQLRVEAIETSRQVLDLTNRTEHVKLLSQSVENSSDPQQAVNGDQQSL